MTQALSSTQTFLTEPSSPAQMNCDVSDDHRKGEGNVVKKKKLLVFNDYQKVKLIAILRIFNPYTDMDIYYKLTQREPQQEEQGHDKEQINFQVNFWQGRVCKRGHVDVIIAVEIGEGADKQALVRRLCLCQFSLEMTEYVDKWLTIEPSGGQQKSSLFLKIELYCVTLKFFQHLQSIVTISADGGSADGDDHLNRSEIEQRMVECLLQEKSILSRFLDKQNDEDDFKEEKWIEVVAKGDKEAFAGIGAAFNTTFDKSEGDEILKDKTDVSTEKPKSDPSIGILVISFIKMIVHFVRDLFIGGTQLAMNIGQQLTLKTSNDVSKKDKSKKNSRLGSNVSSKID